MIMEIIYVVGLVFFIWMLIDCLQNKSLDGTMKIVWILVILFLPIIGSNARIAAGPGIQRHKIAGRPDQ
jgi:Phospholipase_D-nuclease N-terminal